MGSRGETIRGGASENYMIKLIGGVYKISCDLCGFVMSVVTHHASEASREDLEKKALATHQCYNPNKRDFEQELR